ncbi:hypothetical protein V6N11_025497 [Hibiscus sabdariffa]|uniref:Uncharacterized protein n=1 Tax=Hibiscus sabdariffa TaxID=183260 RepID=A0ABR2NII8_9ROSI
MTFLMVIQFHRALPASIQVASEENDTASTLCSLVPVTQHTSTIHVPFSNNDIACTQHQADPEPPIVVEPEVVTGFGSSEPEPEADDRTAANNSFTCSPPSHVDARAETAIETIESLPGCNTYLKVVDPSSVSGPNIGTDIAVGSSFFPEVQRTKIAKSNENVHHMITKRSMGINAFSDADWGGDIDDRRMKGNPSKNQKYEHTRTMQHTTKQEPKKYSHHSASPNPKQQ